MYKDQLLTISDTIAISAVIDMAAPIMSQARLRVFITSGVSMLRAEGRGV
jgi:hypothetical protein